MPKRPLTFSTPARELQQSLKQVRDLVAKQLRNPDGRIMKASSERLHALALLTLHESFRAFVEACFARCIENGIRAGHVLVELRHLNMAKPPGDELDKIFKEIRDDAFPRSFGSSPHVVAAGKRWFGVKSPFDALQTGNRMAHLEAMRELRNDIGHNGRYSSDSETRVRQLFPAGQAPTRGKRVMVGTVLRQVGASRDSLATLFENLVQTVEQAAADLEKAALAFP